MRAMDRLVRRRAWDRLLERASHNRRFLLVATISGLICLAVIVIGAGAGYDASQPSASTEGASTTPAGIFLNQTREGTRVEAELITIRPSGFQPTEITRPKGLFLIALENRSSIRDLELRLDREGGGRLHQVRLPLRKLNWKQGLDLPPGKYLLSEANHPEWSCSITITDR